NRAEVTGAALDLLWGSSARVVNCLFIGNASNTGPGEGYNPFTNNGAITVFPRSKLVLEHSTLTGNRNGVDDMSGSSEYRHSIFAANQLESGPAGQKRYELDLQQGAAVENCVIKGRVIDPLHALSSTTNNDLLSEAELTFDQDFVPQGTNKFKAGYRPARLN